MQRPAAAMRAPWILISLCLWTLSCAQPPAIPFARLLDQAASWAAATRYANELQSKNLVPDAYLNKVVDRARQETTTIAEQIDKSQKVSDNLRAEAARLSVELLRALGAAASTESAPDPTALAAIERQFRSLAVKVRGQ
jgi:predicted unusual protein kinase regulating ubiquinone biosynthesis (AarF/ABC1/UbiB family)